MEAALIGGSIAPTSAEKKLTCGLFTLRGRRNRIMLLGKDMMIRTGSGRCKYNYHQMVMRTHASSSSSSSSPPRGSGSKMRGAVGAVVVAACVIGVMCSRRGMLAHATPGWQWPPIGGSTSPQPQPQSVMTPRGSDSDHTEDSDFRNLPPMDSSALIEESLAQLSDMVTIAQYVKDKKLTKLIEKRKERFRSKFEEYKVMVKDMSWDSFYKAWDGKRATVPGLEECELWLLLVEVLISQEQYEKAKDVCKWLEEKDLFQRPGGQQIRDFLEQCKNGKKVFTCSMQDLPSIIDGRVPLYQAVIHVMLALKGKEKSSDSMNAAVCYWSLFTKINEKRSSRTTQGNRKFVRRPRNNRASSYVS